MPLFGRAHECKKYEHWSKNWVELSELYRKTKETPKETQVKHELAQANRRIQRL